MKKLSKVLVLVLSAIMVLAMSASVFAAEVTVTTPDNTPADASNTYTIYKVFDATSNGTAISYKLRSGDTLSDAMKEVGFVEDAAGNIYLGTLSDTATGAEGEIPVKIGNANKYLTPQTSDLTKDQIDAIAAYVTDADKVGEETVTGPGAAEFGDLDPGFYYITTTTGTAVVIKSNAEAVNVQDKNEVPTLNKKAKQAADSTYMELDADGKKAIAQVGKVIPYEATITVAKGAENYVFHDVMTEGLEYQDDLAIKVDGEDVDAANYDTETAAEDTITVTFDNEYIASIVGKTIVITYSAKVTSDALSVNPAKNTATLDYGDENGSNSTPKKEVEVYNAKFTVSKEDGDGEPLGGAGFVLKNNDGKYYKIENSVVTWVESIDDATEYTSGDDGAVPAFKGLGNGTYTLEEKTVPAGYNKAADYTFTVSGSDYTTDNLEQSTDVVNNAGAVLPGTGGIGTTIFYVLGSLLVVGCGIVLVSRRRMKNNK